MPQHLPPWFRKAGLAVLAMILVAAAPFACRQKGAGGGAKLPGQQTRKQKMDDRFTRYWGDTAVTLPPPVEIHPAVAPVSIPREAPKGEAAVVQEFVNAERNSRIGAALGPLEGNWKIQWRADIEDVVQPSVLLMAGDRLLAYGASAWQLFDTRGQAIRHGVLKHSGVTLDPERSLFYGVDQFGLVATRSLTDGGAAFTMRLRQTEKFERRLIHRYGSHLVTVGYEIPLDPHAPEPEYSIAEVTEISDPANRKSWIQPGGPAVAQDLVAKAMLMLAAMHDGSLVLALRNGVYVADTGLEIRRNITGNFTPGTLSLDEAGRIYLVVQNGAEISLWLLTPEGERIYAFRLPPGVPGLIAAPVVGYNHVVYLISATHAFAVGEDGKLNWSREFSGKMAGAVVTADDVLLTSEGSQVVARDQKGERHVVHVFPEELATEPVLSTRGELIVASHGSLFCAVRQP